MNRDELEQHIKSAFSDVLYPGDNNIVVDEGRNDSEYVLKRFQGRLWESIRPHEMWRDALDFMSPEAFRYYLPAFLLVWDDEEAVDVVDALLYHLTPPELDGIGVNSEFFYSNFRDFSSAQRKAISEFLDFIHEEIRGWYKENGGLDERTDSFMLALCHYWRKL